MSVCESVSKCTFCMCVYLYRKYNKQTSCIYSVHVLIKERRKKQARSNKRQGQHMYMIKSMNHNCTPFAVNTCMCCTVIA